MKKIKMKRSLISSKSYSHTFHIALKSIHHINNILSKVKFCIRIRIKFNNFSTSIKTSKGLQTGGFKAISLINNFFLHLINIYNLSRDLFKKTSILWALKEDVKKLREKLFLNIFSSYFSIFTLFFKDNNLLFLNR